MLGVAHTDVSLVPAVNDVFASSERALMEVATGEPSQHRVIRVLDDGDVDVFPSSFRQRDHPADHEQGDAETESDPGHDFADDGDGVKGIHLLSLGGARRATVAPLALYSRSVNRVRIRVAPA